MEGSTGVVSKPNKSNKTLETVAPLNAHATISYDPPAMKTDNTHDQRIAKMTFASVYPLYLAKVEKKGRTRAELDQVIKWLTGLTDQRLQKFIDEKATFEVFFAEADLNPNARLLRNPLI